MAPLSTNVISHFMHPAHQLNHLTTNTPYLCDGCKLPGTGSHFTCTTCSFDLHDYCANCPTRLTSSTIHQHPMSLVVHKPVSNQFTESCQTCSNPIKGLAYHCKDCNLWMHPLCVSTKLEHNQDGTAPTGLAAAGAAPSGLAAGAQALGQQIGVNVASKVIVDKVFKREQNEGKGSHALGSNEVPPGGLDTQLGDAPVSIEVPPVGLEVPPVGLDTSGVGVDGTGFFDGFVNFLMSIVESSSA
ncbi:hypothetical protein QVD17_19031 [Tagetes erecta]|uniref:DC1 domain-containing protein n=1 Tax=Tagetes erecta TaxID=13708 RepID=A0AAD8NW67_TARER|nr:hypothetical protein QVD17_19031 [Tagetes erecta]